MSTIAYVDSEMQVHVANRDGTEETRLEAPGESHTWPVWAPRGGRLVFSGFSSGSNGRGVIALYLHEPADGPPRKIYANEPGTDALAQGTPHYALWSPNGERLAFLARTWKGGLTLFALDLSDLSAQERIIGGFPLFMSWSPDSRFLLAHAGENHFLADFDGKKVRKMPGVSRLYMAPSWSPVDNRLAFLQQGSDEHQALLVGLVGEGEARVVTECNGRAAFGWSPDGRFIGLARDPQGQSVVYRGLWVVAADGSEERKLAEDLVMSFFWSPTGSAIAYITGSDEAEDSVRWGVVNTNTGSTHYLPDFRPTAEQMNLFMFFDQYSQSHNPWSPDGKSLVFAGTLTGKENSATETPSPSSVLIADVESQEPPVAVAHGVLGTWSRD